MQTDELTTIINEPGKIGAHGLSAFLNMDDVTGKPVTHKAVLVKLLQEHEGIIISLRKNINACDEKAGNAHTTVFLTTLMNQHEAIVGILKMYMDKASANPLAKTDMGLYEHFNNAIAM